MVAFNLPGGIPVYAFSLLLAVGVLMGLGVVILRSQPRAAAGRVEAGAWALTGGLIGGRAGYVILAWPVYQRHIGEAFRIYLGGMSWPGALAGGILALAGYALLARRPFAALADSLAPLPVCLGIAAWLGCLLDGYAYGSPNNWVGIAAADEWGVVARRFPVQILGAALCLVLLWLLDRLPLRRAGPHGLKACLALVGLAAVQFGAALLAAQSQTWRGLPFGAWAALLFAGIGLVSGVVVFRGGQTRRE